MTFNSMGLCTQVGNIFVYVPCHTFLQKQIHLLMTTILWLYHQVCKPTIGGCEIIEAVGVRKILAACSQSGHFSHTTSGEVDLSRICKYLRHLNQEDVVKVGTSLGLNYSKLRDLTADKIPHEMVQWWLGKRDNVMEISGTPTLKSLVKALEENGFNGHAKSIEDANIVMQSKKTSCNIHHSRGMYLWDTNADCTEVLEFDENMKPAELFAYLHSNQIPARDCEKIRGIIDAVRVKKSQYTCLQSQLCSQKTACLIKLWYNYPEKEIGGIAFKRFSDEQWKAMGISDVALVAIQYIKEEKVSLLLSSSYISFFFERQAFLQLLGVFTITRPYWTQGYRIIFEGKQIILCQK